jgi:flagellar rod assembly protein/muramidase FlgJ
MSHRPVRHQGKANAPFHELEDGTCISLDNVESSRSIRHHMQHWMRCVYTIISPSGFHTMYSFRMEESVYQDFSNRRDNPGLLRYLRDNLSGSRFLKEWVVSMTPQEFIDAIYPAAQQSAKKTGIPASFTVAEAALESGWGSSKLAQEGFNLFGVKADPSWEGAVLYMNTREFLNGHWIMLTASWRKYVDWLGAIADHADFLLSNPRYAPAFATTNGIDFASAVAQAGYATDPEYARKITLIIQEHNLEQLGGGSV